MSENIFKSFESLTDEKRLIIEMEFVQNLANARYLLYLSQNRYLSDERFLQFLKYLRYWKEPKYAKLLIFPQCLAFLDALLDNESFRNELTVAQFTEFIHQQQGSHWKIDAPKGIDIEM